MSSKTISMNPFDHLESEQARLEKNRNDLIDTKQ